MARKCWHPGSCEVDFNSHRFMFSSKWGKEVNPFLLSEHILRMGWLRAEGCRIKANRPHEGPGPAEESLP